MVNCMMTINLEDKKDNLGKGIFLALYIALKPIYLRASGTLQLCDIFLVLISIYLFVSNRGKFKMDYRVSSYVKTFALLCFYQFVINIIWTCATGTSMLRATLYYLFNFIAFFDFAIIADEIGNDKVKRATMIGGFISLVITSVGLVMSLGSGGRGLGYFNNPNQLGYYALIVFTYVLVCGQGFNRVINISMIVMSVWAVIASSSKAAFLGIIISTVFYILFASEDGSKKRIGIQLLGIAFVGILAYVFFFSTNRIVLSNESLLMMRRRILNMSLENDTALGGGRGYDRIKEVGIHLLWGVGEGAYNRFQTMTNMEVHSTFASLIVSYGLIGFIGYVTLFFKSISNRRYTIRNLAIVSGLLFYQMSHNGIRNTLLWLLLAILLMEKVKNSIGIEQERNSNL